MHLICVVECLSWCLVFVTHDVEYFHVLCLKNNIYKVYLYILQCPVVSTVDRSIFNGTSNVYLHLFNLLKIRSFKLLLIFLLQILMVSSTGM